MATCSQDTTETTALELTAKYLDYRGPVTDSIESYNLAVGRDIPAIMAKPYIRFRNKEGMQCRVYYELSQTTMGRSIETPEGRQAPLWPSYARLHNQTYDLVANAQAVVEVLHPTTQEWTPLQRSKLAELFRIPCMVRSKYCNLVAHQLDDQQLVAVGENPADPGGDFIIDGLHRFMPYVDRMRYHTTLVLPPSEKNTKKLSIFAKQTVVTGEATCQMKLILGPVGELRFESSGLNKMASDTNRYNSLGLLHLIAAMAIEMPPASPETNPLLAYLQGVARQAAQTMSPSDTQRFLLGQIDTLFREHLLPRLLPRKEHRVKVQIKYAATSRHALDLPDSAGELAEARSWLTRPRSISTLSAFIDGYVFPNLQPFQLDAKLWSLALMACRLLRVEAGVDSLSLRDNWSCKRLPPTGERITGIFRTLWRVHLVQTISGPQTPDGFASSVPPGATADWFIDQAQLIKGVLTTHLNKFFKNEEEQYPKGVKAQVTEILKKNNMPSVYGQLGKIASAVSDKDKSLKTRGVRGDQKYRICPVTTSDGANCGNEKSKAMTSIVTSHLDPALLVALLLGQNLVQTQHDASHATPVILNGYWLGWCLGWETLQRLLLMRRRGEIDKFVTVCLSGYEALEIYTDAGRVLRPVLVVNPESGQLSIDQIPGPGELAPRQLPSFSDIVAGGHVDFLDAYEEDCFYNTVADDTADIANHFSRRAQLETRLQETSDPVKRAHYQHHLDNMRRHPFNYCSLHPVTMYGVAAMTGPYSHHNASCRVTYHAKMSRQALAIMSSILSHDDTEIHNVTAQYPLVNTSLSSKFGMRQQPSGSMVTLAFASMMGNEEDGVVVASGFLDRGGFRAIDRYHYAAVLESEDKDNQQELMRPNWNGTGAHDPAHALCANGLPAINAYVTDGDYIIGIGEYPKNGDKNLATHHHSVKVGLNQSGYVKDVVVRVANQRKMVSIVIEKIRRPHEGDKFSSRYSQKVTIGRIVADEDMPFVESGPMAGMRPDFIINPTSIPSRMTIGFLYEVLAGIYGADSGNFVDATAFETFEESKFTSYLKLRGYSAHGNQRFVDGITGELIQGSIFTGPCYYYQLPHISAIKIYGRGWEEYRNLDPLTQQPLQGKAAGGGLKFGNMEIDAILANKAAEVARETLVDHADKRQIVFCRTCHQMAHYEASQTKYVCPTCPRTEEQQFGVKDVPYIYKLFHELLLTMWIDLRPINETYEEMLQRLNSQLQG